MLGAMTEVHCGNVTGHLKPYKQFKNGCAFSSSCDAFGSSEEADLWWWWWSCLFPLFMRLDVARCGVYWVLVEVTCVHIEHGPVSVASLCSLTPCLPSPWCNGASPSADCIKRNIGTKLSIYEFSQFSPQLPLWLWAATSILPISNSIETPRCRSQSRDKSILLVNWRKICFSKDRCW